MVSGPNSSSFLSDLPLDPILADAPSISASSFAAAISAFVLLFFFGASAPGSYPSDSFLSSTAAFVFLTALAFLPFFCSSKSYWSDLLPSSSSLLDAKLLWF
jgi:hypothetical protein